MIPIPGVSVDKETKHVITVDDDTMEWLQIVANAGGEITAILTGKIPCSWLRSTHMYPRLPEGKDWDKIQYGFYAAISES